MTFPAATCCSGCSDDPVHPSTIILIPNYLTVVGLNETFNNFYATSS
jgi:hypothetical protein